MTNQTKIEKLQEKIDTKYVARNEQPVQKDVNHDKIEKLQEKIDILFEVRKEQPKKYALQIQNDVNQAIYNLKHSEDYKYLTIEGQLKAQEKIKSQYKKQVGETLVQVEKEYKQLIAEIAEISKDLILSGAEMPSNEQDVAIFNKELNELKLDILLTIDGKLSVKKLGDFVNKYGSVYYQEQIKNVFGELTQVAIKSNSDVLSKQQLANIYESVKNNSKVAGVDLANQGLQLIGDGKFNLFSPTSIQAKTIGNTLGSNIIKDLNSPSDFIAKHSN